MLKGFCISVKLNDNFALRICFDWQQSKALSHYESYRVGLSTPYFNDFINNV